MFRIPHSTAATGGGSSQSRGGSGRGSGGRYSYEADYSDVPNYARPRSGSDLADYDYQGLIDNRPGVIREGRDQLAQYTRGGGADVAVQDWNDPNFRPIIDASIGAGRRAAASAARQAMAQGGVNSAAMMDLFGASTGYQQGLGQALEQSRFATGVAEANADRQLAALNSLVGADAGITEQQRQRHLDILSILNDQRASEAHDSALALAFNEDARARADEIRQRGYYENDLRNSDRELSLAERQFALAERDWRTQRNRERALREIYSELGSANMYQGSKIKGLHMQLQGLQQLLGITSGGSRIDTSNLDRVRAEREAFRERRGTRESRAAAEQARLAQANAEGAARREAARAARR